MYYGGNLDFVILYLVISNKVHISTVLDRPCTRTILERLITNATLDRSCTNTNLDRPCTKTTSTPRAGGPAKPGHAASLLLLKLKLSEEGLGEQIFEAEYVLHLFKDHISV